MVFYATVRKTAANENIISMNLCEERIIKFGDSQNAGLTPDKELHIWYTSPPYIQRLKTLKRFGFWPVLYAYRAMPYAQFGMRGIKICPTTIYRHRNTEIPVYRGIL